MKTIKKKEMIKRADGSTSQRGLWDNIRANKGSGKEPTAQMLKQEKKIKSKGVKKAPVGALLPLAAKILPAVASLVNNRNKKQEQQSGGMKKGGKLTKGK